MRTILSQDVFFHTLLRCFWISVCTCFINFYLMFTLRYRQADIAATVSSLVLLIPAINYKLTLVLLLPAVVVTGH
jgi:hypothetical protein